MENIILHVYYEGSAKDAAAFAKDMETSGALAAVRAEEGCLQYEYFTPVSGEGLLLLEKWKDAECLKKHSEGGPMKKLKEIKAGYALNTRLERYE